MARVRIPAGAYVAGSELTAPTVIGAARTSSRSELDPLDQSLPALLVDVQRDDTDLRLE